MSNDVRDFDDVRAVVQLYVDGNNSDVEKLQRAFHPAARMAGRFGAEVDDNVPVADYISWVAAQPVLAGPEFRSVVRTMDLSGDAGMVVLLPSDWAEADFVNYLSVARFDGRWQITNKTYAHVGGVAPSA
jgi:hypothetical protein